MTRSQETEQALGIGEPLLQSRQLACDASRKGLPWRSERTKTPTKDGSCKITKPKATSCSSHRNNRRKEKESKIKTAKESVGKKIHISSIKKAQFSHILPDQRGDSCIHESPIVYESKGRELSRKEVAPLWYHPLS